MKGSLSFCSFKIGDGVSAFFELDNSLRPALYADNICVFWNSGLLNWQGRGKTLSIFSAVKLIRFTSGDGLTVFSDTYIMAAMPVFLRASSSPSPTKWCCVCMEDVFSVDSALHTLSSQALIGRMVCYRPSRSTLCDWCQLASGIARAELKSSPFWAGTFSLCSCGTLP